jgi:hypothetical protein
MASAGAKGSAAWNQDGWSWEERDFTKWSHAHLKTALAVSVLVPLADGKSGSARITVDKVDGETVVLFLRGKKRLGYELTIKLQYAGDTVLGSTSGLAEILLESDTGGTPEYTWKAGGSHVQEMRKAVTAGINAAIESWKKEQRTLCFIRTGRE